MATVISKQAQTLIEHFWNWIWQILALSVDVHLLHDMCSCIFLFVCLVHSLVGADWCNQIVLQMECASHNNPLLGWVVGLSLKVNLLSSFCAIVEVQSERWNVKRVSPLSERWEPQVDHRLTLNITYQGRRQHCFLLLFAGFQNVDNTEELARQLTSPPHPTILSIMQPVLSSLSFLAFILNPKLKIFKIESILKASPPALNAHLSWLCARPYAQNRPQIAPRSFLAKPTLFTHPPSLFVRAQLLSSSSHLWIIGAETLGWKWKCCFGCMVWDYKCQPAFFPDAKLTSKQILVAALTCITVKSTVQSQIVKYNAVHCSVQTEFCWRIQLEQVDWHNAEWWIPLCRLLHARHCCTKPSSSLHFSLMAVLLL